MTIPMELFESIESPRFSAHVNLASDVKAFMRFANARPEFTQFLDKVVDHSCRREVAERIVSLSSRPFDRMCENPADAAVATYIIILCMKDEGLAREVASAVLPAEGWWWAWKVAEMSELVAR